MVRMLEGDVLGPQEDDPSDDLQGDLREARIRELESTVRMLRAELQEARRASDHAMGALRRQLSPLYKALQAVFGELDNAGVGRDDDTSGAGTAPNPRHKAIWDNWKSKLAGYPARIIDVLLLHKDMNTQQLAIAVGCHKQRISEGILKLNKAGLINKNGGRFSLKELGR